MDLTLGHQYNQIQILWKLLLVSIPTSFKACLLSDLGLRFSQHTRIYDICMEKMYA